MGDRTMKIEWAVFVVSLGVTAACVVNDWTLAAAVWGFNVGTDVHKLVRYYCERSL